MTLSALHVHLFTAIISKCDFCLSNASKLGQFNAYCLWNKPLAYFRFYRGANYDFVSFSLWSPYFSNLSAQHFHIEQKLSNVDSVLAGEGNRK